MIRDAMSYLKELLSRFLEGIRAPEKDLTLPEPLALREEAKKYE